MKTIIFSLTAIYLTACGTTSKSEESYRNQQINQRDCAITIYLISKGSGIDREALKSLDEYLRSAKEKYGTKIESTTEQQGREGERKYCIQFQQMEAKIENQIRNELAKIVNNSELVRMN
ncbi:MAG: hypothetical protein R2799_03975 [Crocinitomicaceae bacterium]